MLLIVMMFRETLGSHESFREGRSNSLLKSSQVGVVLSSTQVTLLSGPRTPDWKISTFSDASLSNRLLTDICASSIVQLTS